MRKKKTEDTNKWVEEIKNMSDEEFLENEKRLLLKYGLFSGGSFLLAILGVVLFLIIISS